MQGSTSDGQVASALFCFLIKSLAGKCKDLVVMYPTTKLTASKQYECYLKVAAFLKIVSFNVIAISVDNATANHEYFTECLCKKALQTNIVDTVTG